MSAVAFMTQGSNALRHRSVLFFFVLQSHRNVDLRQLTVVRSSVRAGFMNVTENFIDAGLEVSNS